MRESKIHTSPYCLAWSQSNHLRNRVALAADGALEDRGSIRNGSLILCVTLRTIADNRADSLTVLADSSWRVKSKVCGCYALRVLGATVCSLSTRRILHTS